MTDLYQLVKENADERSELTERQDADVLLRNLAAYVMKKVDNKTNITGVVNVTLNRPKVMAAFIIAALGNTSEQIVVETENNNFDTDYIKDFRRLAFAAVDVRLRKKGLWDLNPYLDEQACIRGGGAARCLFQLIDGVLVPDIMYWDYRYTNYEMGVDDYQWVSYGYGTKRKKADIESEAWWKTLKNPPDIKKEAEVVDIWTPDHNEVCLGGVKVFEQEHSWDFTPVVIRAVSLGSMLSDEDDIKNHGESIFFLIREAIPELNRLVSILQTHNLNTIKRAVQTPSPSGRSATPPDYEAVTAPGASSSVEPNMRTEAINLGDITNAAVIALNIIDKALEEGGLSASQLGLLGAPPASGIALITAKEGRDIIFQPRLATKASIKQALGDMLTAQVMQIGGTVEIGTPGHKRKFQTGKLEGQYEVTHQFSVKSLSTQAGLASLAAALGNSIPERAKRREILGRDDPDGDERWLRWEEAERLSPLIKLRRIAKDLIELDEDEEAKLITDEAGIKLEQLLSGTVTPLEPEAPQESKQVLGLFGGGTGRTQPSKQPEMSTIGKEGI